MCFVKQYMIVSAYGTTYCATKAELKEAARKLQLANVTYDAYEWVDRRSHYKRIGGWCYGKS